MREPPTSRCLALQRVFDPNNLATATDRIAAAGVAIETAMDARSFTDLNEGQFAALIDLVLWKGIDWFTGSAIFGWANTGNLTYPTDALAALGKRGMAERDMWNLGNSE